MEETTTLSVKRITSVIFGVVIIGIGIFLDAKTLAGSTMCYALGGAMIGFAAGASQ
jgi:F0F1-type ATP synthase assembly protein I